MYNAPQSQKPGNSLPRYRGIKHKSSHVSVFRGREDDICKLGMGVKEKSKTGIVVNISLGYIAASHSY